MRILDEWETSELKEFVAENLPPIDLYIDGAARLAPTDREGVTEESPFFLRKEIRVAGSCWISWLGHESFHARLKSSLQGIPLFVQEGLADWFGTRGSAGYSELGAPRWADLLDSRSAARLKLGVRSDRFSSSVDIALGSRSLRGDIHEFAVGGLIGLDRAGLRALSPDARSRVYAMGFAVADHLIRSRTSEDFANILVRRSGETAAEYVIRLSIPSVERLRTRALERVDAESPTAIYWLSLRSQVNALVRECAPCFESEEDLIPAMTAILSSRGEELDLLEDPRFSRLISEQWLANRNCAPDPDWGSIASSRGLSTRAPLEFDCES